MKKIFMCSPVRNREWILPRFIKHIKNMNLNGIELDTLFLINDCEDNSEQLLKNSGFKVKRCDNLKTKTTGHIRGRYSYSHLAELRNHLIEEFLKTDNEYFFSVDSDILLPEDGLIKLLSNNKEICSMILCNQDGKIGQRAHNIMNFDKNSNKYVHIYNWDKNKLINVDLTGAVYLIHRSVLEKGVRYAYNVQGEDIPFCKKAKSYNFSIFCDTSIKPIHVMAPGIELISD